jgi:hypothetical protein
MASRNNPKYRTHRYRFGTSMSAGIALVLALAYVGHKHHDSMPAATGAVVAVAFGLVMYVTWTTVHMIRRAGERARAQSAVQAQPGRRRVRQGRV